MEFFNGGQVGLRLDPVIDVGLSCGTYIHLTLVASRNLVNSVLNKSLDPLEGSGYVKCRHGVLEINSTCFNEPTAHLTLKIEVFHV